MKRSHIIPLFLLSGLCLASGCGGCGSEEVDLSSAHTTAAESMAPADEPEETDSQTETEESEASSRPDPGKGLTATVETYSSGGVSIEYPSVTGMNSSEGEEAVNELLKSNALSIIQAQGIDEDADTLSVTCEILSADRQQLTAIYTGELTADGAAHPTAIFYTNTVDMDKAVDIGFSTYAEPSTMAGYVMSEGCQFDGLDGETKKAVREYIAGQSMDYFTELFRGADFPLKGDTFPESFSYETEGDIFFSIPVPHALGDYAIVKFTPDTK